MKKSDTEQEQPGPGKRIKFPTASPSGSLTENSGTGREGTPGRDILRRTTARET